METVLLILAVLLIILSLLQSGKTDGISSAFTGGESLNIFSVSKELGPEKFLSNATLVVGIAFFVSVIINIM